MQKIATKDAYTQNAWIVVGDRDENGQAKQTVKGEYQIDHEGIGCPLQYSWAFLVAQLVESWTWLSNSVCDKLSFKLNVFDLHLFVASLNQSIRKGIYLGLA